MSAKDGSSTKPLWTEEFSVHASEDSYVLRRQFTKFLVLTSFGMVAGNAWIWMRSLFAEASPADPAAAVVARGSEVPVGGVKLFTYPTEHDPAILVRKQDGTLAAFSQKCTHLSCAVVPKLDEGILLCPCHEGVFELATGRNIAGPPPRPLPSIELEVAGDEIFAIGVKERTV